MSWEANTRFLGLSCDTVSRSFWKVLRVKIAIRKALGFCASDQRVREFDVFDKPQEGGCCSLVLRWTIEVTEAEPVCLSQKLLSLFHLLPGGLFSLLITHQWVCATGLYTIHSTETSNCHKDKQSPNNLESFPPFANCSSLSMCQRVYNIYPPILSILNLFLLPLKAHQRVCQSCCGRRCRQQPSLIQGHTVQAQTDSSHDDEINRPLPLFSCSCSS